MKIDVKMPRLGESITEGTIIRWLKQPGDFVKRDEPLLEISTDKVDSEIPSPFEGTLVEILARENETVAVDSVIAIMEAKGGVEQAQASAPTKEKEVPSREQPSPAKEPQVEKKSEKASKHQGPGNLVDVVMPRLGEGITEGTIIRWLKKPGERVEKDEPLLEISTDKVDSEIPSPYGGVLKEILHGENETVAVDTPIARMEVAGVEAAAPEEAAAAVEAPEKPLEAGPAPAAKAAAELVRRRGGRFFSPLVLSIARKEGISAEELERIPGSGAGGRVTKNDILQYLKSRKAGAPPRAVTAQPTVVSPGAQPPPLSLSEIEEKYKGQRVEIIPMDNIRKKIAEHMVRSKATSAHVYGVAECDFTRLMELVRTNRSQFEKEEGFKLTINPFILFAVVRALKDFPRINSSVEGEVIVEKKFINLGIAVATEKGLIVPVIRNAEELSLRGIARHAYTLAMKARERTLTLDEIQGSTFTVTNYGVFGNIFGFPIINQPNVAIMGVGAIKKRPVVIETPDGDFIGIRSIGYLTLSYDHRIIDGELGDKFLQRVVTYIQEMNESVL